MFFQVCLDQRCDLIGHDSFYTQFTIGAKDTGTAALNYSWGIKLLYIRGQQRNRYKHCTWTQKCWHKNNAACLQYISYQWVFQIRWNTEFYLSFKGMTNTHNIYKQAHAHICARYPKLTLTAAFNLKDSFACERIRMGCDFLACTLKLTRDKIVSFRGTQLSLASI